MANEPYGTSPYPPSAPPTVPGALPVPPTETRWPTVLGIIGIVFGVGGTLSSAWGIVGTLVMSAPLGIVADSRVAAEMERLKPVSLAGGAVGLVLAILLLASGAGLLGRRRWAVSNLKVWAVLRMIVVVAMIGLTWSIQKAAFEDQSAFRAAGGPPQGFVTIVRSISVVFGLLWGWALPVLMLIWLSRQKIKAEVQGWR